MHDAVRADTGEVLDRDMWALLEDLRIQNRLLMEENSALRMAPPLPPEGDPDSMACQVEQLKRQLATVMESKAAEINEDNLRLLNTLTEVCMQAFSTKTIMITVITRFQSEDEVCISTTLVVPSYYIIG